MSKSTTLLIEALESTASKAPPYPRRAAVWKYLLLSALVVPLLQGIEMLAQDVWSGWHTGDWDWRWFEQTPSVMAMTFPLAFAVIFASLQEAHIRVRLRPGLSMLIAAAVSGDDQWAPVASEQPKPIAENLSSVATTGTWITLSAWLRNDGERPVFMLAALVPVAILVQALEFIFIPATDTIHLLGFMLGVAGVALCAAFVFLARSSSQLNARSSPQLAFVWLVPYRRRTRWFVADAEGISWLGFWAGKSYISWSEAQAFISLANPTGAGAHDVVYALVGREAIFVWVVTPQSSEAERRASDLLCQRITTHTGLPLRDIGSAIATLDATTPRDARRWSEHIQAAKELEIAPFLPTHKHRMSFVWPLLVFYTLFPTLYYGALYFGQHYATP